MRRHDRARSIGGNRCRSPALIALRDLLNSGEVGNFRCVNVNVEVAQVARDDIAEGIRAILNMMAPRAPP